MLPVLHTSLVAFATKKRVERVESSKEKILIIVLFLWLPLSHFFSRFNSRENI